MFEEIDSAAQNLLDINAGGVIRRDAADLLGKAAARALAPLHECSDEMDMDVRRVVEDALGHAAAVLEGVTPVAETVPKEELTLEELVRGCEKPNERTVEKHGEGFLIRVALKSGRHRSVKVRPVNRKDGVRLYQVYTICGKPNDMAYVWALRANMKMAQGSLALASDGEEERFVLTSSFLVEEVSPKEIRAAVKEIAYFGDWIEGHLNELDEF